MGDDNSTVLGAIFIIRHGDRQNFYQNPTTYVSSTTLITPLGLQEEVITGNYLRSVYLNESSPSFISGINATISNPQQITVKADAAGEGGVIMMSSQALLQGLFPPTPDYNISLANGTNVTSPLGGYQFIEVDSAEANNDISLEGWTDCAPFDTANTEFYQSAIFNQTEKDWADFFTTIPQYLGNSVNVNLENMWNVFDFMNVNYVHNATFQKALPPTLLAQARTLAAFHEYNIFTSPQLDGIGNIGFRTMVPGIIGGLADIANSSNPLKIYYNAIAYKNFFTLFRMTNAVDQAPQLTGLVNYASSIVIEVRQPSSGGEPVLRLQFKNGTEDDALHTFNWFNTTGDIPMSTFTNFFAPVSVNTTADWCTVCSNTQDRGCGAIAAAASQAAIADRVHQPIGPVGAGFLGAGLTLFVALCMLGMLYFLGALTLGRGRSRNSQRSSSSRSSDSHHSAEKVNA
ncbi:phosphoglycerate mutase-like protein [Gymnopus androsaceus JB14]|uniref:Phosphoglycerate mutase-like protein n=1 Tax=Gymnopus androsaceus JB14 TaxID=1447944 RepID=A0A6A4IEA0_9AGAR|nr:phosphoglycerate mutase-like protein [Gymnopus androsaceus JB14]